MHFLAEYGLFLAKIVTWVVAILIVVAGVVGIAGKGKGDDKSKIKIKKLNNKLKQLHEYFSETIFSKKERKQQAKAEKQRAKKADRDEPKKRLFVIEFNGDVHASASEGLRQMITALLGVATAKDEVLIKLESKGGAMHAYGFAASQLQRLRKQHIPLTIAVDKVAASGGYMMACVAERIIAAPFAIVGSIGVIAQVPNFHKVLKKHNIEFEQHTAGEYKRTLSLFGENTNEGRKKFKEEIDEAHVLFKQFITENRPQVLIDEVATGEHWFAIQAKKRNLVDELMTSDDYIVQASKHADVYLIKHKEKKGLAERLGGLIQQTTSAQWL